MQKSIVRLLLVILMTLLCQSLALQQTKLKIAIIPKGSTQHFWKLVQSGANAAANVSKNVEVVWKAPITENDKAQQIQLVEKCIDEGVSGIALAPLDYSDLAGVVAKAMKKNIPVVIFDSALKGKPGEDFVSFIGTDNKKGGTIAGEYLAELLGNTGTVTLLRYMAGQASTTDREEGFIKAIANHDRMQLLKSNRYAGGIALNAWAESTAMMDTLRLVRGVFCPNESSTTGMLQALRQAKLAGTIRFVGFDNSEHLIDALKKNEIDALVIQDPYQMGYLSVKTLVDHLRGKKGAPLISTGVNLVTRKNVDDPDIKKFIDK